MSKAKKNILFAALAALALTVCLVGVTGAYFIAQASRTNTLTVGEVTFDPKEDIQNPDVPVQPGNSFMKRPYVVNTGNLPLRLRARVIFSDSAAQDACTLNYNTENWRTTKRRISGITPKLCSREKIAAMTRCSIL